MLTTIEIFSTHKGPEDETGSIYRKAEGDFCLSPSGEFVLSYDEMLGEEGQDGAGQDPVHTRAVIGRHSWKVTRTGAVESEMVFVPGRTTACEYTTPYGCLTLTLDQVQLSMEEEKTDAGTRYAFEASYRLQGEQYSTLRYSMILTEPSMLSEASAAPGTDAEEGEE